MYSFILATVCFSLVQMIIVLPTFTLDSDTRQRVAQPLRPAPIATPNEAILVLSNVSAAHQNGSSLNTSYLFPVGGVAPSGVAPPPSSTSNNGLTAYLLFMIPFGAVVNAVFTYFVSYRHLRKAYYRCERATLEFESRPDYHTLIGETNGRLVHRGAYSRTFTQALHRGVSVAHIMSSHNRPKGVMSLSSKEDPLEPPMVVASDLSELLSRVYRELRRQVQLQDEYDALSVGSGDASDDGGFGSSGDETTGNVTGTGRLIRIRDTAEEIPAALQLTRARAVVSASAAAAQPPQRQQLTASFRGPATSVVVPSATPRRGRTPSGAVSLVARGAGFRQARQLQPLARSQGSFGADPTSQLDLSSRSYTAATSGESMQQQFRPNENVKVSSAPTRKVNVEARVVDSSVADDPAGRAASATSEPVPSATNTTESTHLKDSGHFAARPQEARSPLAAAASASGLAPQPLSWGPSDPTAVLQDAAPDPASAADPWLPTTLVTFDDPRHYQNAPAPCAPDLFGDLTLDTPAEREPITEPAPVADASPVRPPQPAGGSETPRTPYGQYYDE